MFLRTSRPIHLGRVAGARIGTTLEPGRLCHEQGNIGPIGMRTGAPISFVQQFARSFGRHGRVVQEAKRTLSVMRPKIVRRRQGTWLVVRDGTWFQERQNLAGSVL